jgi:hypothetical protein
MIKHVVYELYLAHMATSSNVCLSLVVLLVLLWRDFPGTCSSLFVCIYLGCPQWLWIFAMV